MRVILNTLKIENTIAKDLSSLKYIETCLLIFSMGFFVVIWVLRYPVSFKIGIYCTFPSAFKYLGWYLLTCSLISFGFTVH